MGIKTITNCSEHHFLMLFKKQPLPPSGLLLHIPTDNYKYDLYFHLVDADTVKVSMYRWYQGESYRELQDSFVISASDYVSSIDIVDKCLSVKGLRMSGGCAWVSQSAVKSIFSSYGKFEQIEVETDDAQMGFDFESEVTA
jgi:hypothetical protein